MGFKINPFTGIFEQAQAGTNNAAPRSVTVANQTALFALTSAQVAFGDKVIVTTGASGNKEYYEVLDTAHLGSYSGYGCLGNGAAAFGAVTVGSGISLNSDGSGSASFGSLAINGGAASIDSGGYARFGAGDITTGGNGTASFAKGGMTIGEGGTASFGYNAVSVDAYGYLRFGYAGGGVYNGNLGADGSASFANDQVTIDVYGSASFSNANASSFEVLIQPINCGTSLPVISEYFLNASSYPFSLNGDGSASFANGSVNIVTTDPAYMPPYNALTIGGPLGAGFSDDGSLQFGYGLTRINPDGSASFANGNIQIGADGTFDVNGERFTIDPLGNITSYGTALVNGGLGVWGYTPLTTQPAAIANATDATDVITRANAILAALRNYGIIAS